MKDVSKLAESATVSASAGMRDSFKEATVKATVHKYWDGETEPYEVLELTPGNLLTFGGASSFWDLLIGAGNQTAFNNANAYIGVGESNTAAAATQTDLIGASKIRNGMEATYPLHTDGTSDGSDDCVFKVSFATGEANFAWEEWAVFNHATAGRMLQRKVETIGTKTSAAVWTLTVTLSLA